MDEWLSYKPSGKYITENVDKTSLAYTTFIPDPLLNLTIKMDAELVVLLSNAHKLLGRLEGMSDLLPNVKAVNNIMLHKEAWLSSQLDGIVTPFYDVIDTFQRKEIFVDPINSYVSAITKGLEKVKSAQYKNEFLCEVHKELDLKDNCGITGEFRKDYASIGKIMVISNVSSIYNPTSPTQIAKVMKDLEKFVNRDDEIDALIKVALAHYQFETIQPFSAGNGFVGRILPYLILADKKILTSPLVCLSHFLSLNKVEYMDRMEALRHKCDYEQWIKFFIKAIVFAADDSLKRIKEWIRIRKLNLSKIEQIDKKKKAIRLIYDSIERHPIFDINIIAKEVGISYNTCAAAIKLLSSMDIIQPVKKVKRYRNFALTGLLDCFFGDAKYRMI